MLKWENCDIPTHICTHRRIQVHKDAHMHTGTQKLTQKSKALEDAHMQTSTKNAHIYTQKHTCKLK